MEITLLLPKIKPLQLCKGYNIAFFGTNSVKSIFFNRNVVVESFCRKPIKLVSAISVQVAGSAIPLDFSETHVIIILILLILIMVSL